MTAVAAYRPSETGNFQFRYTPQTVQTLARGNNPVYTQIQRDVSHMQFDTGRLNVSPRVPKEEIHFVKVGQDEYFMGGPSAAPQPFFPIPTKPGMPCPGQPAHGAPNGTAPVFDQPFQPPVNGPVNNPPANNGRVRFTERFAGSFNRFWQGSATQAQGMGETLYGVGKAAVYAPAGALEGTGRAAIALTGGRVVYDSKTPMQNMGEGFAQAGQGMGTVIDGAAQSIEGAAGMVVYAPLAGLELTAKAAGVAAGGVAAVGYGVYRGAAWTGKQVKESFVGQEFLSGFNLIASHKPQDN
ncbi:hypothetical protein COW36_04840 [bacterium (Candidatus Blackallbacteria) CG17_big_fil_post_rev_8_21_14_2_50_48_46]|uniref:Uncharacterized protein n=1 Tax=bacterium (Candidatus Blackallbacteria) CG17_big_fil_post_rev_8_21_14_2_50_48_46 TaxID=2014261 RepID=A0A2M7G927_9BACT|nr:MAG: hypothetical protein COW64_04105 [bacterium (Candidatus Blackallbacteria) CG18_big_fil_WC_8_21_14_2_50_49_26]PIW18622.1 MAG: hypothetical protein COW36_04840 [bacterium (Candidatus Blackallbacteria) CG17_big_fil_post_rev_8_21_14_2_50_48_46]PIW46392.1 MAG: hypothetical protein COW20_15840 [bacterium (Candidatus Blackallbacteria) CG13_big_fil_rev_8_21_14_2_50_49_14]